MKAKCLNGNLWKLDRQLSLNQILKILGYVELGYRLDPGGVLVVSRKVRSGKI